MNQAIASPSNADNASRPLRLRTADPHSRDTLIFAHIAFISCIILQRFGIPVGGSGMLSLCLPVFWILAGWMLLSGRGRLSAIHSLLFLAFAAWAMISAIAGVLLPDARVGFSLLSLLNLLFLYTPLIVRPTSKVDGRVIRDVFLFYARLCAVAGILQFALQFAGVRLFSFAKIAPFLRPVLLEQFFAWNPVLSYGSSILRSSGFFPLEPSIFSQILCIAILIDLFIVGKWRYLPLYAVAYVISFSGTGLLTLAITLAVVGFTSIRFFARMFGLGVVVLAVAVLTAVVFPSGFSLFAGRFGELSDAQTSGYARYVAPLNQVQAFSDSFRLFLGYGPGSTMRSIYFKAGSGNAAVQLYIDYGLIGLTLFMVFLTATIWNHRQIAVTVILLVMFELGGGYLLFSPFIILLALLGIWMPAPAVRTRTAAARPTRLHRSNPRRSWGHKGLNVQMGDQS